MMAAASVPPSRPGLLLTHDWSHMHTPRAFLHTTSTEVDEPFLSRTFPISNALQFHTFVNGLGRCEVATDKNCPLQLVAGLDSGHANACPQNPLSAIVKMNYKVTHTQAEASTDNLVPDDVVSKLLEIETHMVDEGNVRTRTTEFLKQYGSHFAKGVQRLGKCFSWIVVVDEQCQVNLLQEIAEEIFQLCYKYDSSVPGSQQGIWYSLRNVLDSTGWSEEKKKLLQVAKLCVTCHDSNKATTTFTEWKENAHDIRPVNVSAMSESIVSIWDLVAQSQMKFQVHKKLSSFIQDGWKRLVEESQQHRPSPVNPAPLHFPVKGSAIDESIASKGDPVELSQAEDQVPKELLSLPQDKENRSVEESQNHSPPPLKPKSLDIPHALWGNLLEDLEMQDYYPAKITMQQIRALREHAAEPTTKADLPWKILSQLMFLNSKCREEDISTFMKEKEGKKRPSNDWLSRGSSKNDDEKEENIPHPMDVTLLVYLCADYMLRQVLAKKLFMCCLAIPFIVPTRDDAAQILLWPLRTIVMQWRTKQEAHEKALVTSNVNMVAFMRFGQTTKSKSKLMNTVLSDNSHDTFCHKDTPCGNRKRQISNGTVEMSHYLPSSAKSDHFSQPALFFNLRGDACAYPVQHRLLMELATVTVILLDLHELKTTPVQQLLQRTVSTHPKLVLILTDDKRHNDKELDGLRKNLITLLGDHLKDVEVVTRFEKGRDRNGDEVIQEVRECIAGKMVPDPQQSLEDFAESSKECSVDEDSHQPCKAGRRLANKISSQMNAISSNERKQKLLPRQGQVLHETGKLLKQLHRSAGKGTSVDKKVKISGKLKTIKEKLIESSEAKAFMDEVLAVFDEPSEEGEVRFAVKWLQLELDAISGAILPKLHNEKNKKWDEMMKAKDAQADYSGFENDIAHLEKQIDAGSLGLEHIMREMAQWYDVAADLGQLATDGECKLSSLPAIAAGLLLDGHPLELMDGDHGLIPLHWVKAVFHSLARLVGEEKKLFVLSVMGIQSSGKSTLLNAVFGLEFAVSAGRCTKGIYAQLLPVAAESQLPFDYMLVLDSEGLRAQELGQNNYEHDNELATLVIGLSDLALVNMKGENVMEITDILQIVVLAFLRMKQADSIKKSKCMFIHQNVSAVNAEEKLAVDRQKFQEQLNEMTSQASESQGLHQAVTSFNHVITFEGERDTVYFSDLWHGDPPMAPVNQGYSARAAETQQRILTDIALKNKSFLSIPEFVVRINDIWKGVLSDDFIFHFRNTLAAKAYLDLERQFGQLTMEMEEDLLQWVNTSCNAHMLNCHTEVEVESKCTELKGSLSERVSQLQTKQLEKLEDFFESHAAREIITQWEEEKKLSLQSCAKSLSERMEKKLKNMRIQRSVEVQQEQMFHEKKQVIMAQAIELSERLRGNCPPDALGQEFDKIWNPWAEEYIKATSHQSQHVKQMMDDVLEDMLKKEGGQRYLHEECGRTHADTHAQTEEFTSQDLTKCHTMTKCHTTTKDHTNTIDHITIKEHTEIEDNTETQNWMVRGFVRAVQYFGRIWKILYWKRDDSHKGAVEQANAMMRRAMEEIDRISQQELMFDQVNGRQVITFALNLVTEYNDKEHILFSFTPQFRALFALRAVHYAVPAFERMNQRYEERHGIHTKLAQLKQRIFKQFQNAVQDASVEVTCADDFSEAIKGPLKDHVKLQIDQQVVQELHQALGIAKYDLITKILDEIVDTRNFESLCSYVQSPVTCARKWIRTFGNRLLFEDTKYGQLACTFVDGIIRKLRESTQAATHSVLAQGSNQYSEWVTTFHSEIEETIPLDAQRLRATGTTAIKDFKHFQKCLDKNLKDLENSLKEDLCATTADSVRWAKDEDPFQRVFERMWGCQEICPLCGEPCQYTDENHTTAHACIQHRPSGVGGTNYKYSSLLAIETCNMDVASTVSFSCKACNFKCRETPHCTSTGEEEAYHPYSKYKKFLPGWDIAPDPSGEASKFWKWIMCTFQDKLVQEYTKAAGVEIPDSWKDITEQQARDSLREFFQ